MGYKHREPVDIEEMYIVEPLPEKKMKRQRYTNHNTICQILREIFQLSDNEDIKYKCRVAMAMAKAMHNKLKEYKENGRAREEKESHTV